MIENLSRITKPALLLAVSVLVLTNGCGKEKANDKERDSDKTLADSTSSVSQYADWLRYTYDNFQIIYPAGHPQEENFQTIIDGLERVTPQACNLLGVPVPTDTIRIIYYTGYGQGRKMTGRQWPFVAGDTIHLWQPSYPQVPMVEYILRKWQDYEPKFQFLKVGLMVLLDYSGVNYHASTLNFVDDGILVPLADLAVDTTINPYGERWQSAEAASFMAYLLDHYGIKGLFGLYRTKRPFEEATMGLFSKTPETLQKEWLRYADSLYTLSLKAGN